MDAAEPICLETGDIMMRPLGDIGTGEDTRRTAPMVLVVRNGATAFAAGNESESGDLPDESLSLSEAAGAPVEAADAEELLEKRWLKRSLQASSRVIVVPGNTDGNEAQPSEVCDERISSQVSEIIFKKTTGISMVSTPAMRFISRATEEDILEHPFCESTSFSSRPDSNDTLCLSSSLPLL